MSLKYQERFWTKAQRGGSDECWIWTGSVKGDGYGRFWDGQRYTKAHRYAYELTVGAIPQGLVLDHLCHSRDGFCAGGPSCPHRACVNPAHLEPVPQRVNVHRGLSQPGQMAHWTHCAKGHAFDERNTITNSAGRLCRKCRNARRAEELQRRQAKYEDLRAAPSDVIFPLDLAQAKRIARSHRTTADFIMRLAAYRLLRQRGVGRAEALCALNISPTAGNAFARYERWATNLRHELSGAPDHKPSDTPNEQGDEH